MWLLILMACMPDYRGGVTFSNVLFNTQARCEQAGKAIESRQTVLDKKGNLQFNYICVQQ